MKTLYAVPWIEIEYGWCSRNEGYKVFETLEDCTIKSIEDAKNGNYDGGYFGPEMSLRYYETPDEIIGMFPLFVDELKFKSKPNYIPLK